MTRSKLLLAALLITTAPRCGPVEGLSDGEPPETLRQEVVVIAGCGGCTSTYPVYASDYGCDRDQRILSAANVTGADGSITGTVSNLYSPSCWQVWSVLTLGPAASSALSLQTQVVQSNPSGTGTTCGCWAYGTGTTIVSPMAEVDMHTYGLDKSRVWGCAGSACGATPGLIPPMH